MLLPVLMLGAAPVFAQDEEPGSITFAPDDDAKDAAAPAQDGKAAKAPAAPAVHETSDDAGPDAHEPPPSDNAPRLRGHDAKKDNEEVPELHVKGREQSVFGSYRVRISYLKPHWNDHQKFYNKLYGDPSGYPAIQADWFAWDWYATLGISMRLGYYTADGHAGVPKDSAAGKDKRDWTDDDITVLTTAPTTFTMIPLQACLTAELTPFSRKWVVLEGWAGYERAYFQEVRTPATSTSTTTGTGTTTTSGTPKDTALTTAGWKNSTLIGAAANILLNPVDETSAQSMRGSMGIGSIYLSPFMQIIHTVTKTGLSVGRTEMGLGFTFETVR